jgi:hypothetical protein
MFCYDVDRNILLERHSHYRGTKIILSGISCHNYSRHRKFCFKYKLKTVIKSTFSCCAQTLRIMEINNRKRRQETRTTVSKEIFR